METAFFELFTIPEMCRNIEDIDVISKYESTPDLTKRTLMIDFSKLEFDDLTTTRLFDFCMAHRLGLADTEARSSLSPADFKFHVTVMYSKVNNPAFQKGVRDFGPHVLTPEGFDMFGPNNDILVLKLRRDDVLTGLFDHYRDTYGHVSEFMPFQPHVSIRGSGIGARDRIGSLPVPDFELCASRLVQKVKSIPTA